ncbi:MAG: dihydroorotate oxidase [Candidatus Woesearchaeota archaeon]|nr:dihydroorotate oxidase [Candidatus Woesearchaeota archaeon]
MQTTIASVTFEHPIFNAAGPLCVTTEELNAIGNSSSSAIVTKSCTRTSRDGNPEPRYRGVPLGSINSMGLPNRGYKAYINDTRVLKEHKKPIILSVSGLSLEDNCTIITAANASDADLLELNLSCPNVPGKPQVGYDFEQTDTVLAAVMKIAKKPLGVKLPPYFDFVHFEQVAKILNKHNVAFVTCINSIGNALYIDPVLEEPVIKPKGGFGGLGGQYIKPTALANVRKFSELLDCPVIGVGGIEKGVDVFEFILAGAHAVQLGTVFMEEGVGCFERIRKEFEDYCAKKGYTSVEDFRGKLKTL